MEVRAVTKYTGISAQKARLIVNEVRGRQAEEAMALLQFMPQSAARTVAKTIKSALATRRRTSGWSRAICISARSKPTKRLGANGDGTARRRFKPWIRRSSHITVVLQERISGEQ